MVQIMHKLLVGLGFEGGYVAQGGDIGSYVARLLLAEYESCKGQYWVRIQRSARY